MLSFILTVGRKRTIIMTTRKAATWLVIVLLTGASIACVTVGRWLEGFPASIPTEIPLHLRQTQNSSASGSPATTPELDGTTAEFSPTQLAIFNELWQVINDEYLYPDFNGVDWEATRVTNEEKILGGLSSNEFYLAMDEMVASLGDDHSVYLSPEAVMDEEAMLAGSMDYVGVGVYVSPVVERDRAVILLVFPNSPADRAGLKPRDSILKVDGESVIHPDGFMLGTISGPEGTEVLLTVETPGELPRDVTLVRAQIGGAIPVPYWAMETPGGLRIGYLLIVSFADGTVADQVSAALNSLGEDGPLDGLIIDNRMNEGGIDTMLIGTLKYFSNGTLGYFTNRWDERSLRVKGMDIYGSQSIPMVLIIGPETVSFGEIFAGVLQHSGRAYLIGQPTDGNMEVLWGYDFEDGSRAWIAHDSFRPDGETTTNWEKTGIIPDQEADISWDLYSFDTDPAIRDALGYLDLATVGIIQENP